MNSSILNNVISEVTGRIFCDYNYILVGNAQGIAIPTAGVPIGALPNLTLDQTWVGDAGNRPIERPYIGDTTFLIREPNSLLPSAQVLDSLYTPSDPTLLKVITNGYLALAIADTDYATVGTLTTLANNAANSASAASTSATAAAASATAASASATAAGLSATAAAASAGAAAASAALAAISATDALNYYNNILATGLNALPNHGDIDVQGYRVKNVAPSPVEENDAVTFAFVWALLNNEVEVTFV